MEITLITKHRQGILKIHFIKEKIYEVLRDVMNYRIIFIGKKGYIIKNIEGKYQITTLNEVNRTFTDYIINNFEEFEFNMEISKDFFLYEWYNQNPIKIGFHFMRVLKLEYKMSDEEKQQLLDSIDKPTRLYNNTVRE